MNIKDTTEFDLKFGIPNNPKCFAEGSNGEWAGCDDCPTNLGLREEHKKFLLEDRVKLINSIIKWCIAEQFSNPPINKERYSELERLIDKLNSLKK